MPNEEEVKSGIVDKFVKTYLPLLMIVVSGVVWGTRLESQQSNLNDRVTKMEIGVEQNEATLNLLKIEQTKLSGQIETLKVMLTSLQDTAKRIEDKLDAR